MSKWAKFWAKKILRAKNKFFLEEKLDGEVAYIVGLNKGLYAATMFKKLLHFYSENTLAGPLFIMSILKKSLQGHSKSLGGPKMAHGPRVGRPWSSG